MCYEDNLVNTTNVIVLFFYMFQRFGGSDSPKLQTQIYIISGVFGVLMFILILLVLALAVAVARLAKQLKERNGELKYRAVSASGGGSVIEAEHESNMSPPDNRRSEHLTRKYSKLGRILNLRNKKMSLKKT